MSTATSSSDRYAEARAALQSYDLMGVDLYSAQGVAGMLAEALRALIEPAAVNESPAEIADRMATEDVDEDGAWSWRDSWTITREDAAQMYSRGVSAGIQAAWNSWESDDYAPTVCDKCGCDA